MGLRETLEPHAHVLQEEACGCGQRDGVVGVEVCDVGEGDGGALGRSMGREREVRSRREEELKGGFVCKGKGGAGGGCDGPAGAGLEGVDVCYDICQYSNFDPLLYSGK